MRYVLLCVFSLAFLAACSNDPASVSTTGQDLFADQQYYPVLEGSSWNYRLDSAGVKGVAEVRARMIGNRMVDSLSYAVQVNQVIRGGSSEIDTQYIRERSTRSRARGA